MRVPIGDNPPKRMRDIPLRDRHRARMRLAFLDTASDLMRSKRFANITVRELCERVEVSEKTFFNHFAAKGDLLLYAIRMWSIEAVWHAQRKTGGKQGLAFIDAVFEHIARGMAEHDSFFLDTIAWHATDPEAASREIPSISTAERRLRFPDLEGIEDISEGNVLTILSENFRAAASSGEIPAKTDIRQAVLAASAIFFGMPMILALLGRGPELSATYRHHLGRLWRQLKRSGRSDAHHAAEAAV